MADKPPIEIWPKLHALAEQNVAQARTTHGQFMDFVAQTLAASNVMPIPLFSGFSTIQKRSIEYARENAERFFTLESELARAKDMQEALMLQSAYVQTQMKAYALQARELGRLMAVSMPAISRTIAMP